MSDQQYRLLCCGKIFTDRKILEMKTCPNCLIEDPKSEEVDKNEKVILTGKGFSGDDLFEERPWGSFSVIVDEPFLKIKKIVVKPEHKISLQLHKKREEFWVILSGKGLLLLGLDEIPVEEGQPIHIRRYELHSIKNYTENEDLVIIEIQKGVCKEDDIVRIEDDYGRIEKDTTNEKLSKINSSSSSSCCSSSKCKKSDKKKCQTDSPRDK